MRYRYDDERGYRGGYGDGSEGGRFPERVERVERAERAERDGWRESWGEPRYARPRHFNRDEDMGGSDWSGASGRGGMAYRYPDDEHMRGLGHERARERERYGFDRYGADARDRYYGYGNLYEREPREYGTRDWASWHDLPFGIRDEIDRGPHYGKGPKGYKRSDERVREDVCDIIAQQGYIDASDVEVRVENGVVIFSGTIVERHHKRALEQMIEHVLGIEEIHNELRLKRMDAYRSPSSSEPPPRGFPHNGRNARA